MRKQVPKGHFVYFTAVDPRTTETDVQQMILNRTGVYIGVERISIDDPREGFSRSQILISFSSDQLAEVFRWALSEDTLQGVPFKVNPPKGAVA
jgi:hypothetical protein